MKVDVLDTKGKKVEEINLNNNVFGIKPNLVVLSQYIRVFLSNLRQGTSSTKTRGEVSGGGKKPWRQKGTGRARVGSSRNPVWRHGGISHGPKPKSWKLGLPKKVRSLAIRSAISQKFLDGKATVLSEIDMKKPSTKEMIDILRKLNLEKSTLLVLGKVDKNVIKSTSNIEKVKTIFVDNINAFDLLKFGNAVFDKAAILKLEGRYK